MLHIALLLLSSTWTTVPADRCDVVVTIDHWAPWGGNEVHRIQGYFWQHSVAKGCGSIETKVLRVHDFATAEIREGIRVAERARIVGRWMDVDRKVMLPLRVEVIERRADQ